MFEALLGFVKRKFILVTLLVTFLTGMPAAATRYEAGIATGATLLRMKDADLNDRLGVISRLGAKWIRVDFSWRLIQPNNGQDYDWKEYDRLVEAADQHNLKILAVINYTPAWAREPECAAIVREEEAAKKCAPRDNQEFGRFARAMAIRYRGKSVRAWEIWNEPNIIGHWKSAKTDHVLKVDPRHYAQMANVAAMQIKHYYPDSVVITGGLAPMFEARLPKGMRQSDYLAEMLPLLEPRLFDGIAIHPYSWPNLPSKAAVHNAFYTVDHGKPHMNLRTIMNQHGWDKKEIWGTEYGASTKGSRSVLDPITRLRPDHVTEWMQAGIVKQGVEEWYKKSNVGPLFVYSDSDEWFADYRNEGGFGLRRKDKSKKPAFGAMQEATRRLNMAHQEQ